MKKKKQNQYKETLDYLEEEMAQGMADQLAKVWEDPRLASSLFKGEYTDSEFEWLAGHGSGDVTICGGRSPTWHRQNKRKALLRTQRAAISLFHASYLNTAFEEEDWLAAFPLNALSAILYFACLRGGQIYAYQLAKAMNDGLNENLKTTTNGFLKAQVCPQIFYSEDKIMEVSSKLGRRVSELTKEKVLKESESEEEETNLGDSEGDES